MFVTHIVENEIITFEEAVCGAKGADNFMCDAAGSLDVGITTRALFL